VQVRSLLAAVAALLLMAALLPQATPSGPEQAAGDGDDQTRPAVDREGPRSEGAVLPAPSVGAPGAAAPAAEHGGAPGHDDAPEHEGGQGADGAGATDGADDHVAVQGEPQVVYRYDIEIRGEVASDTDAFAAATERILTDARGWTLGGSVAFERSGDEADVTVVLASPEEVDATHEVCSREYSCRVEDEILVNDRNWREATPAWHEAQGDLATYRRYLLNHELGHFLGFGHHECGGPGERAPVMQQQSVSMQACEPNAWPLDWERHVLGQRLQVPVRDPAAG
jgi:hypothetical protein